MPHPRARLKNFFGDKALAGGDHGSLRSNVARRRATLASPPCGMVVIMESDRTCLSWWFPLVEAAGLPVPVTEIVRYDAGDLALLVDGEMPSGFEELVGSIQRAGDRLGWPVFLRTGHISAKHDWNDTCYVPGPEQVGRHVAALVEWSSMVDIMGLPTAVWVVREMLAVEAPFSAFGGMPVARERRWWIADGAVVGHHPYWPPDALRQGRAPQGFETWLAALNEETAEEIGELRCLTEAVAAAVPGRWSVDWLFSPGRGWVLIDMAEAERSWVWDGHPTAPSPADRGVVD